MTREPREPDLTEELVARIHRTVERSERPGSLRRLTDADFAALAAQLCEEVPDDGFWLFAYGSLIWKPDFEHVDSVVARAHGWRRAFCLNLIHWRATPEVPGLMLALAPGGSCHGVAYRMPDDDHPGRMLRLLRRELDCHEDVPWLRWITVRSADGVARRALAFYCAVTDDPDYVRLPLEAQADRLARAVGFVGTGAEYLRNTVLGLRDAGIHDRYLWRLQSAVAARIRAAHEFA